MANASPPSITLTLSLLTLTPVLAVHAILHGFLISAGLHSKDGFFTLQSAAMSLASHVWLTHSIIEGSRRQPLRSWLSALLLALVLIFGLVILLGASVVYKIKETLFLSIYLVSSGCLLPSVLFGLDETSWRRIYFDLSPVNDKEVYALFILYSTAIGAFVGATPIPLDWEETWQLWPRTVLVGATIGNLLAYTLGWAGSLLLTISKNKRYSNQGIYASDIDADSRKAD